MINTTEELKNFIIKCLEDKKAENISILDIEKKTVLAKYMIFASGRSIKNIGAIADYISFELKHIGFSKVNIEGLKKSDWVILDAGEIIVHIFHPAARENYKLEELWMNKK